MRAIRILRFLALLVLLLLAGVPLFGQAADPNTERGLSPGKAYEGGEPDIINLFNGNLNATVPIGQTYRVGGNLSYGFHLNYGGNGWEPGHRVYHYDCISGWNWDEPGAPTPIVEDCTINYQWSFPTHYDNAGMGWLLTLGSLFQKQGALITDWTYQSPDGGLHDLKFTKLHSIDTHETVSPNVFYSTDATYLRLTVGTGTMTLEFPDGMTQTYEKIGSYPATARLTRMEDRFGNYMTIAYNDPNIPDASLYGGTTWHVQDSQGRHHYVYFRPGAQYNETTTSSISHEVVAEVRLSTFGGALSSYYFHYEGENGSWSTLLRPRSDRPDPTLSNYTAATLLTSVVLPDTPHSSYAMTYEHGDVNPKSSGFLTALTLPTQGKIAWTYQSWLLNNPSGVPAPTQYYTGVATRTVTDAAGTPIARTEYGHLLNEAVATPGPEGQTTVTIQSGDGSTILEKRTHYFSTCVTVKQNGPNVGPCIYPSGEYGLPFSRLHPDGTGTRFLSTQSFVPDANGNWTVPSRTTYVRYDTDKRTSPSFLLDNNRRLGSQRTVYEDGAIADDDYSDFDGLGHYRTHTTNGTFGRADVRTSVTNFNPAVGTFTVNPDGTLAPGFTMLSATAPWILGTYTYITESETLPGDTSSTTSMTQACFVNGFLTRRRTLRQPVTNPASPTLDGTDLLAVFTPSAGNIAREQYLGGDNGPAAPLSNTCGATVSGEAYRIDHQYSYGSLASSQYFDENGAALSFKNVDQDIDPSTGYVSRTRARADSNGASLVTDYTYDSLGRLTDVKPASGALRGGWTQFVYSMAPPRVDVNQKPNGGGTTLIHSATQFDVLGRVWRELRDIPGGTTAIRETLYNGAGWKASVSESEANPTHKTVYSYDPYGRPTRITAPDNSFVTLSYTGTTYVDKTVGIRTAGDANVTSGPSAITDAVTRERYDRQGRLWQVTEPSGTLTEYTYDLGERLSKVCMNGSGTSCGQVRSFVYDLRGFLGSETHPELGSAGNGSTSYLQYDARGHAGRRQTGTSGGNYDLTFGYDRAERLRTINYTGSGRPLKTFTFGTDNDSANSDYRNGQLTKAVRYNWYDVFNYGIQIHELYTYAGREGNVSRRQTLDYECILGVGQPCTASQAGTQRTVFDQTFSYDAQGLLTSLGYPSCAHSGCSGIVPAPPTVTNGYDNGFLTSVNWTGNVTPNTISYWPNGLVNQVAHSNSVTDTQGLDENGMSRPAYLTTIGATDNANCVAPTITANPQAATITSTTGTTLNVAVAADSDTVNHPLSHQWYAGASGDTSVPVAGQTTPALPVTTAGTYWARVTSNCGTVNSAAAAVTMCTTPAVSSQPASPTITQGMQINLSVGATGSTPTFQWYQGTSPNTGQPLTGQTTSTLTVAPVATTSYWARLSNACGTANSVTATVTVVSPPPVPYGFYAEFNGSSVFTAWVPVYAPAGLHHYEIERAVDGLGYAPLASNIAPNVNSFVDSAPFGKAYLYRIRAVDINNVASPWSDPDLATTVGLSDEPLTAGVTLVQAVHISELREAIDAVRRTANLPPQWGNYNPPTGLITATNIAEMRDAIDIARSTLGLPTIRYSYELVSGLLHLADISELRDGVK